MGVVLKSIIPATIIALLAAIFIGEFALDTVLVIFLYIIILEIFIASITIMISVINDTVVSAQTAFLPIFLILVAVCVTCIQSVSDRADFYMYLPVYGQFYGIGDALTGTITPAGLLVSSLATIFLTAIITFVTIKLLSSEKYTVSIDTVTAKEIKASLDGSGGTLLDTLNRITDNFSYFIAELFYPLFVLSFYQFLAMLPVVVAYMRKPEYSKFIQDLANVGTIENIMNKTFEVLGIFLADPLFLALMNLGYLAIIFTYFLHAGRVWKIKGLKNKIGAVGYPLTDKKHIAKHYGLGFVFGFLMMTSVVLIMLATGQISFSGFNLKLSGIGVFILNLLMWVPQGASEELMFRGYMIPAFKRRFPTAIGVLVSSLVFSAFHSLNSGYTPLASVNLVLIAVLFALIYLYTGDIWMTSAMHTAWNLTQGNIYGLQVSGNNAAHSVVLTNYSSDASSLITGGAFGPEGGLAVTAVTCVCLIIITVLLIVKSRKAQK